VSLLLARAGVDVLLLDRAVFPRAKPCAEYMSPGVVRVLHEIGAGPRVERAAGTRLYGFVVDAGGRGSMEARFGRAAGHAGAPDYGLGIPRRDFDAILVNLAREAGVRVCERTRVTDVVRAGGRAAGVRALAPRGPVDLAAPLIVGADGVAGVTGRRLGMLAQRRNMRRFSLIAHVQGIDGLGDLGEMHTGPAGYCGVAPLGDGVANAAMVLPAALAPQAAGRVEAFFLEMLGTFGDLGRRTERVQLAGRVLRTGPLSYRARALTADGVALIGDAGGFYDPFTGQGVYRALRSAQLAAPVLLAALRAGDTSRGRLLPYERARRREFRGGHAVEWLVQRFLGRPALLERAIRQMDRRPEMADTLLGVTGDVLPARRVLSPLFLARLVT
jgi:flavin-dependent dehydrogenase